MKTNKSTGNVTVMVLVVLAFAYFLFDRIINLSVIQNLYGHHACVDEQLKMLVYAGFSFGLCKMNEFESGKIKNTEDSVNQKAEKEQVQSTATTVLRLRSFYLGMLEHINSWHQIDLKNEVYGIDATIKYSITCEEGKFNFNQLFDFSKREFKSEAKLLFEKMKISNISNKDMNLEKYFASVIEKAGNKVLFDISELLGTSTLKLFYDPSFAKNSKEIFFADLFTIFPIENSLQPFFLSKSLLTSININSQGLNFTSEEAKNFLKKIKDSFDDTWANDKWSSHIEDIESFYGLAKSKSDSENAAKKVDNPDAPKEASAQKNLNKIRFLFSPSAEPEFFSIRCLAEYFGRKKEAVLVFKRQKIAQKYKDQAEKSLDPAVKEQLENEQDDSKINRGSFFVPKGYEIIRIYWL